MMKILIDTNIYAAFKRNDPAAMGILRKAEYIGINAIVIGELLGGFRGGSNEEKNVEELDQFLDSPRVEVLDIDERTADFYSRLYWRLKMKGKPLPTNDMWVAASAMQHGLTLFTFDDHFDYIDGLSLIKGKRSIV